MLHTLVCEPTVGLEKLLLFPKNVRHPHCPLYYNSCYSIFSFTTQTQQVLPHCFILLLTLIVTTRSEIAGVKRSVRCAYKHSRDRYSTRK